MVTLDLQNLLVCRNILKDKLVQELAEAVASPDDLSASHRFAGHLMEKAEQEGWSGNLIRALFLHLLSQEGCLAAKMAEAASGKIGTSLKDVHIVGTPGAGFGPCGEGYFRLTSFGNREKTIEAVDRIKSSLKF